MKESLFFKDSKRTKSLKQNRFCSKIRDTDRQTDKNNGRERERKKELNDPIIVDVLGSCCFGVKGMGSFHCERVQ